ncbi:MAG: DUF1415 domain-containing protein, partial [Vibrio sp.]
QIRIFISQANTEQDLLEDLLQEFLRLEKTPVAELETTLVVAANMLADFYDYNFFLDWVDALLKQQNWQGVYQVASFHPDYCFAGADPSDDENLTNRAPYPILHLIREDSMEKAVKHYPSPETIPDVNIERVSQLSDEEKLKLFPHIFKETK